MLFKKKGHRPHCFRRLIVYESTHAKRPSAARVNRGDGGEAGVGVAAGTGVVGFGVWRVVEVARAVVGRVVTFAGVVVTAVSVESFTLSIYPVAYRPIMLP